MEIYREESSVVLRYASYLKDLEPAILADTSIREGARIIELPSYRDIQIDVLDLSTLSTTGTFKDWVACLAVATCLKRGLDIFVSQSSGNTGNSLGFYAFNAGVRCVILYPVDSRRKIKSQVAALDNVRFIEVHAPEAVIKSHLAEICELSGALWLPLLENQLEGNKLRAYFLRDAGRELDREWDWHVQALSSAYGIFGFYRGVAEIQAADGAAAMRTPKLLGVQQEAVAPYVTAVTGLPERTDIEIVEPTLFRKSPPEAFLQEIRKICSETGGTVARLDNHRYFALEDAAINMLESNGIYIDIDPKSGNPRERAGLYSLTGTLDAIERGTIEAGSRVLVVFTGGAPGLESGTFEPEVMVSEETIDNEISAALTELNNFR